MKEKTACFTGHRFLPNDEISEIKKRLKETLERLINNGVVYYGCGGTLFTVNLARKFGLALYNIAE